MSVYTFTGRVRYSETDSDERLTLPAITDYFQDCGTFQSEELGLGVKYLQQSRLAWMLCSWQIVVREYPRLCDEITVGTFPYGFRGFMGYRNYVMDSGEGRRMAYANAVWVLLNIDTMEPARPTEEMLEKYVLSPRLDMEYAPRKIAEAGKGSWEEAFCVQRQHLDSNHHVNNAQYVKMAFRYVPEGVYISQLRAEYKKQALLGDQVRPNVWHEKGRYVIALCGEDGTPFAVVEFTGERR